MLTLPRLSTINRAAVRNGFSSLKEAVMSFWEGFNRFVGIQGLIALIMLLAYVASPFVEVLLPEGFTELMSLVFGFYFAKNGVGIISAIKTR